MRWREALHLGPLTRALGRGGPVREMERSPSPGAPDTGSGEERASA